MIGPKRCDDVSPQCPAGQEDGYRLGWYQGQIDMFDRFFGTPCQVIGMQQEIDALRREVLELKGKLE